MRVISGTARSIPLKAPAGMETRPTTDKIKETLFNIIQFDLQDSVFLDLFSGSGAIGIEALSRGAEFAILVDSGKPAIDCINYNIGKCHFENKSRVIKCDAAGTSLYAGTLSKFPDSRLIIFMDPPYDKGLEIPVLKALTDNGLIKDDTLIIIEESLRCDMNFVRDFGLEIYKEKEYKNQKHLFLRKADR